MFCVNAFRVVRVRVPRTVLQCWQCVRAFLISQIENLGWENCLGLALLLCHQHGNVLCAFYVTVLSSEVSFNQSCVKHVLVASRNLVIKSSEENPFVGAGLIHYESWDRKLPGIVWQFCVRKTSNLSFSKSNTLYLLEYWLSELRNACGDADQRGELRQASVSSCPRV